MTVVFIYRYILLWNAAWTTVSWKRTVVTIAWIWIPTCCTKRPLRYPWSKAEDEEDEEGEDADAEYRDEVVEEGEGGEPGVGEEEEEGGGGGGEAGEGEEAERVLLLDRGPWEPSARCVRPRSARRIPWGKRQWRLSRKTWLTCTTRMWKTTTSYKHRPDIRAETVAEIVAEIEVQHVADQTAATR